MKIPPVSTNRLATLGALVAVPFILGAKQKGKPVIIPPRPEYSMPPLKQSIDPPSLQIDPKLLEIHPPGDINPTPPNLKIPSRRPVFTPAPSSELVFPNPIKLFQFAKDKEKGFYIKAPEPTLVKLVLESYKLSPEEIEKQTRTIYDSVKSFNALLLDKDKHSQVLIKPDDIPKVKPLPPAPGEELKLHTFQIRDYVTSQLDILLLTKVDGITSPLSYLQLSGTSFAHGFPTFFEIPKEMQLKRESLQEVYYMKPLSALLFKGVYFELAEPPVSILFQNPNMTVKLNGGVNGVIISEEKLPIVIFKDKEVFIIGLDEKLVAEEKYNPEKEKPPTSATPEAPKQPNLTPPKSEDNGSTPHYRT